jgi:hypothetical protein
VKERREGREKEKKRKAETEVKETKIRNKTRSCWKNLYSIT